MVQEIKKSEPQTPAATHYPDVFGAMRNEMDRVFDRFTTGLPGRWPLPFGNNGSIKIMPSVDVRESDIEMVVEAELPGLSEKDVSVTYSNGTLTIKGEKKTEREEKKADYHLTERSFGSFQRTFQLPEAVDESKIAAHFEKGILIVNIAKSPQAVKKEKTIPIGKG